jgi:hypothetical protein
MQVWGLSAALREAGVPLPPDRQKPALFPPPAPPPSPPPSPPSAA